MKSIHTPRKTRSDDVLGNLPESDQEQVLAWAQEMSYRQAVQQIAKPLPEGLGLKVHYNSLRQFHRKRMRETFELDPELLAGMPDLASDRRFALLCRSLENELLMGLDRLEGRDETRKLLSIYLRYRALQEKSARGARSDRFRAPFQGLSSSDLDAPVSSGHAPLYEPGHSQTKTLPTGSPGTPPEQA